MYSQLRLTGTSLEQLKRWQHFLLLQEKEHHQCNNKVGRLEGGPNFFYNVHCLRPSPEQEHERADPCIEFTIQIENFRHVIAGPVRNFDNYDYS